jgi:hypothetical protein
MPRNWSFIATVASGGDALRTIRADAIAKLRLERLPSNLGARDDLTIARNGGAFRRSSIETDSHPNT